MVNVVQPYPSEFCEQLARIFIYDFRQRGPAKREGTWAEDAPVTDPTEPGEEATYELGDRVPGQGVVTCWDLRCRWREERRW